jgi:hypothetical protein
MPLIHGKSDRAFNHNVSAEMHAGKSQGQSLAIAYALKRKAQQHKSHGGKVESQECPGCEMCQPSSSDDMVGSIMKKRYSHGGQAANDTDLTADMESNEFDDLVLRDDLEGHYPGSQEIGNAAVEKEEHDVVSQVMNSRKKKDKNPRPA